MAAPSMKLLMAAGGTASTLPVSGAALWLDASDSASITHSSGAVSQWNDKSGNGRHVSQSTASAKPTTGTNTLNGLNVITFDGGDVLSYSGSTGVDPDTMTAFIVFLESTQVTNAGIVAGHAGATNDWTRTDAFVFETHDNSSNLILTVDSANRGSWGGTGAAPADIYALRRGAGGGTFRNGGSNISTAPTGTWSTATGGFVIGGRYLSGAVAGTNRLNGRIAEIIIYPSALSVADTNLVGNYLERWGDTWTDIT